MCQVRVREYILTVYFFHGTGKFLATWVGQLDILTTYDKGTSWHSMRMRFDSNAVIVERNRIGIGL
jgi:hypothetical protein